VDLVVLVAAAVEITGLVQYIQEDQGLLDHQDKVMMVDPDNIKHQTMLLVVAVVQAVLVEMEALQLQEMEVLEFNSHQHLEIQYQHQVQLVVV